MEAPPLAHLFPLFDGEGELLERAATALASKSPQTREEQEAAIISALTLEIEGDL
jgi:hypothetical protein